MTERGKRRQNQEEHRTIITGETIIILPSSFSRLCFSAKKKKTSLHPHIHTQPQSEREITSFRTIVMFILSLAYSSLCLSHLCSSSLLTCRKMRIISCQSESERGKNEIQKEVAVEKKKRLLDLAASFDSRPRVH